MRPDYCPLAGEPCQSMCDKPCSAHRLKINPQQAKPDQEPVAWIYAPTVGNGSKERRLTFVPPHEWGTQLCIDIVPLYTTLPQRKPLTEEEIKSKAMEAFNSYWDGDDETLVNKYGHGVYLSRFIEFARDVEAAHGIGEKHE